MHPSQAEPLVVRPQLVAPSGMRVRGSGDCLRSNREPRTVLLRIGGMTPRARRRPYPSERSDPASMRDAAATQKRLRLKFLVDLPGQPPHSPTPFGGGGGGGG